MEIDVRRVGEWSTFDLLDRPSSVDRRRFDVYRSNRSEIERERERRFKLFLNEVTQGHWWSADCTLRQEAVLDWAMLLGHIAGQHQVGRHCLMRVYDRIKAIAENNDTEWGDARISVLRIVPFVVFKVGCHEPYIRNLMAPLKPWAEAAIPWVVEQDDSKALKGAFIPHLEAGLCYSKFYLAPNTR